MRNSTRHRSQMTSLFGHPVALFLHVSWFCFISPFFRLLFPLIDPTLSLYLMADYVGVLLLFCIFVVSQQPNRSVLKCAAVVGLSLAALIALELYQAYESLITLGGSNFVSSIANSPYYGNLVLFFVYMLVLGNFKPDERRVHLNQAVFMAIISAVGILLIFLAGYFGIGGEELIARVREANGIATFFVIMSIVLIISKDWLKLGNFVFWASTLMMLFLPILASAKGSIVCFLVFWLAYFFVFKPIKRLAAGEQINRTIIAAAFIIVLLMALLSVALSQILIFLDAFVSLMSGLAHKFDYGLKDLVITPQEVEASSYPEAIISICGRLFSQYVGWLLWMENPFFGAGQITVYSIDIMNVGIHSFPFMALSIGGVFSLVVLMLCFITVSKLFTLDDHFWVFCLLIGSSMVFHNTILIVIALGWVAFSRQSSTAIE